jgi:modulator of FtsH protease HflK
MPWNNQSGGPWGAGGKNPTPPNLEELLRRGQDKLRTVLPGGNLRSKGIGLIVLAAVAIWGFGGHEALAEPD